MTTRESTKELTPRAARSRTLIGARAMFNEGRSSLDCQIRNLSATGARLNFESTLGLPNTFVLEIPSRGQLVAVAVRWRKEAAVGVEFVE
ncbi:MAG: PilZ domain-containing protein [Beijerinckiaceae bacterium]|nr:PilZ domain-containing protein [Beijerinckiaceae bacterium]